MNQVEWIHVNCNQCESDNARLLVQDKVWRQNELFVFNIVQCQTCGLIYTNPKAKGDVFANKEGGSARSDAATANKPIYDKGTAAICKHFPTTSPLKVLDIGSAHGGFLAYAKQLNWDAEGVDINPILVEKARQRGFTIHEGYLDELNLPTNFYDVVTMWDVIEHLDDPKGFLETILTLLKPGGVLFFHTGNANFQIAKAQLLSKSFPNRGPWIIPFQHIYHFDPASGQAISAAAGFEPISAFFCGTLHYRHAKKRLSLGTYNTLAQSLTKVGLPLYTSSMGVLVSKPIDK